MQVSSKQVLKTPFLPIDKIFKDITDRQEAQRKRKLLQNVTGSSKIMTVDFKKGA